MRSCTWASTHRGMALSSTRVTRDTRMRETNISSVRFSSCYCTPAAAAAAPRCRLAVSPSAASRGAPRPSIILPAHGVLNGVAKLTPQRALSILCPSLVLRILSFALIPARSDLRLQPPGKFCLESKQRQERRHSRPLQSVGCSVQGALQAHADLTLTPDHAPDRMTGTLLAVCALGPDRPSEGGWE